MKTTSISVRYGSDLCLNTQALSRYMTERKRARPQTARAQISNPVSGEQCHFTILRRISLTQFSGFSLYVHKAGRNPHIHSTLYSANFLLILY